MKTCPRCGYPGKDLRAQKAGRVRCPTKGFGTKAVRDKALATRLLNRRNRDAL